jgi:hypothetical protein
MKKLKLFLSFIFFSLVFISCEEEDNLLKTFNQYTFVSFLNTEATISVLENAPVVSIPVYLSEPQSSDVTVSIVVTDDTALSGVHYSFVATTITIPAGEYNGEFVLNVVNDGSFNESRKFNVALSTSAANLTLGLTGDVGSFDKDIIIVNDDCPTQYAYWFGALSIEDVGYGSTPGSGAANINGDCDKLIVNNNLPGVPAQTNTIYELVLTPSNPSGSQGTVVVNETVSRTGLSGGTITAVYTASGTYDTATGEIILDYSLDAKNNASGAIVGNYYTGTNIIRLQ